MNVPAVFATWSEGALMAADAWFDGLRPVVHGAAVPFEERVRGIGRSEDRAPAVVADQDSLSGRRFTEGVLKSMRVRGSDIWFMTWIETADDLFDAFNTTADMVMGPYHVIASDHDLDDIVSVSDSFIPVVYCIGGEAVARKGRRAHIGDTLHMLADRGYYRSCVLDTDGSLSEDDWDRLLDDHPSAVPFTRSAPGPEVTGRLWISPLRASRRTL